MHEVIFAGFDGIGPDHEVRICTFRLVKVEFLPGAVIVYQPEVVAVQQVLTLHHFFLTV